MKAVPQWSLVVAQNAKPMRIGKVVSPAECSNSTQPTQTEISDGELFIPGYQLTRMDRNCNGGGVLFYVSSVFTFLFYLRKCDGLELLTVVVSK